MSFLGKIGGGFKKAINIAGAVTSNPLTSMAVGFIPGGSAVLNIANRVTHAIQTAEVAHEAAGKVKSGPEKFAFVVADFQASLEVYNAIAAGRGKMADYDHALLEKVINGGVQFGNDVKALVDSIHEVDLPKETQ